MTNATQILPRLWLGNFDNSQDINFIYNHRITVIINCTRDLPFLPVAGVYKYRVPVHDDMTRAEQIVMVQLLQRILPLIDYHYRRGRAILIHCAAGIQRSAIVMLSYLYHYQGYDVIRAYNLIKQRRPIAFSPSINFKPSFCALFGYQACYQLP